MISIATNSPLNLKLTNYSKNLTQLLKSSADDLQRCDGQRCDGQRCDVQRCDGQRCDGQRCDGQRCDGQRCDGQRCDGKNSELLPLNLSDLYQISCDKPFQLKFVIHGNPDYLLDPELNQTNHFFQVNQVSNAKFEIREWNYLEYQAKKTSDFRQRLEDIRKQQRLVWMNLHYLAHEVLSNNFDREKLIKLIENLDNINLTNCRKCQIHYRMFKNEYPKSNSEIVRDPLTFQQFLLDFHNNVNLSLGRKIYTLNQTKTETSLMLRQDLEINGVSLSDKWNSLESNQILAKSVWDYLFE